MPRNRLEKEDGTEKHIGLLNLVKGLSILVIFIAGVIIGLGHNSNINQYFKSQSELHYYSNNLLAAAYTSNCPTVPVCENEDCLNFDNFVKPSSLIHDMTDEELFWRASMVPTKKDFPFERVPKVAFMFLTRGPLPFLPLWERYFRGHEKMFSVYVHAPPEFMLNVSSSSAFYGRKIPSQDVSWGSPTLTDAEKRLLANALLDFSNERFVLLSESCIPVHNFPTAYKYLIDSSHSFVESFDEPTRYGRGRYSRKMLPYIRLEHWRKGSQWFEVDRDLAIYIISDTKYYSLFRKYCKPACYPDEHYLPTYLNMFHGSASANRTVTWVNWSLGGPHPATYEDVNVTEGFIQSIRTNRTLCAYNAGQTSLCYLFARKFAPSALEPLLNLSSTVMEF